MVRLHITVITGNVTYAKSMRTFTTAMPTFSVRERYGEKRIEKKEEIIDNRDGGRRSCSRGHSGSSNFTESDCVRSEPYYLLSILFSLLSLILEKARGALLDWEKSHSSTPLFLLGQNFFTALFRISSMSS